MGNREPSVLDKIKRPILVGILYIILGCGSIYVLVNLHVSDTYPFVAQCLLMLFNTFNVVGVFLILRRIFRSSSLR